MNLFYTNRGPSYQDVRTLLRSRITYFLMIGLGLVCGVCFIAQDQYAHDARTTFQKAPCVVEDVDVLVNGRDRRGFPISFAPGVTFTFTSADKHEHTVTGYRLYEGGMSEADAEEAADRYEPGQHTFCYYDPANPDNAVLVLEADANRLGLLCVTSILLLFGGIAGWVVVDFVCKSPHAQLDKSAERDMAQA